jgi:sugar phosphate isomerase/epimerase
MRMEAGRLWRAVLACSVVGIPAATRADEARPGAPTDLMSARPPRLAVGYCTDDLEKAKAAGFDYVELGVRNFVRLSEDDFARFVERHRAAGIPTPTGYMFLPGELKVVGPAIDEKRQLEYVRSAFARAARLGIELIVYGSGPTRTAPDGFSKDEAFRQLVAFAKRIAPEARKHGIVVAVEPLRRQEANLINTLAEALRWVEAVDHPSFQLTADIYHLAEEKEDPAILLKAGKRIRHVHFANPSGRVFPLARDEYDYAAFFRNLHEIGYTGRISIEARTEHFDADAPRAIEFLRDALVPEVTGPGAATSPAAVKPQGKPISVNLAHGSGREKRTKAQWTAISRDPG